MKRKTFTSDDGDPKMKQTKLIGFVTQTIKTPAIPIDDSCAKMAVRSEVIETATDDARTNCMMHDDDDALAS